MDDLLSSGVEKIFTIKIFKFVKFGYIVVKSIARLQSFNMSSTRSYWRHSYRLSFVSISLEDISSVTYRFIDLLAVTGFK